MSGSLDSQMTGSRDKINFVTMMQFVILNSEENQDVKDCSLAMDVGSFAESHKIL